MTHEERETGAPLTGDELIDRLRDIREELELALALCRAERGEREPRAALTVIQGGRDAG